MQKTKILFNIINTITIILYVYPGSILGFLIYGEFHKQPQITQDFLSISSNHVYAFLLLSSVGLIAYYESNKTLILNYLFLSSIISKFDDSFFRILSPINVFMIEHSSPIGIDLDPDAITFSTTVDPHLGLSLIHI